LSFQRGNANCLLKSLYRKSALSIIIEYDIISPKDKKNPDKLIKVIIKPLGDEKLRENMKRNEKEDAVKNRSKRVVTKKLLRVDRGTW